MGIKQHQAYHLATTCSLITPKQWLIQFLLDHANPYRWLNACENGFKYDVGPIHPNDRGRFENYWLTYFWIDDENELIRRWKTVNEEVRPTVEKRLFQIQQWLSPFVEYQKAAKAGGGWMTSCFERFVRADLIKKAMEAHAAAQAR